MNSSAACRTTPRVECFVNVVHDHRSDGFAAVRLIKQIVRQRSSGYLRDVLMFADRCDLILFEATKADAIFQ